MFNVHLVKTSFTNVWK